MPGAGAYFTAFWDLSGDRQSGLTIGAISFVAVDAYARRYGYEGEQFEALFHFVKIIDNRWLEIMRKKSKSQTEELSLT